jgi:hypothetical protein
VYVTVSPGVHDVSSTDLLIVTTGRRRFVVTESVMALVCVLASCTALVRMSVLPVNGSVTDALTTRVPDWPPVIWPATAVSLEFTRNVRVCPAPLGVIADPFNVALVNVTPEGSVSTICAVVIAVPPALANPMV